MSQYHVYSSVDEAAYLRGEETAASKHAFVDGEIYTMAGSSERHDLYEDTGLLVV